MSRRLSLPGILSDGCVLQQGEKTRIWGWGPKEQEVSVTLAGRRQRAVVGLDERFEVIFQNLPSGGPYTLEVTCKIGQKIHRSPVYVGEVFVCAGQSNMELPMRRVWERFPEEFSGQGVQDVHLYKVMEHYDFTNPLEDHLSAEWRNCRRENLEEVSAVSYFLGKYLYESRKVPVGIINLSLGGTPIEAWMSREGISKWPELLEHRRKLQDVKVQKNLVEQYEKAEKDWQKEIEIQEEKSQRQEAFWTPINLPGSLSEAGLPDFCGCIRLRKTFQISSKMKGTRGLLRFGTLTDSDQIYINGVLVGETGYCYPPRRYEIPEGLLMEGENQITIRLICRNGKGRITPGKPYDIMTEQGRIRLDGAWEYRISAVTGPGPEQRFINRGPTGLFQGMTAPCLPYVVRGVVWYQGESNDRNPEDYETLLRTMLMDWRSQWRQETLPFVIVQLPGCGVDIAAGDAWPKIREAQRRAAELPDTAVTCNLDAGEANDLHPLDKKTIAYRVSLAIRGMIYGETLDWRAPQVHGWIRQGNQIILQFDTGNQKGLGTVDGQDPGEFELAGVDQKFHQAYAAVRGNEVWITCPEVNEPCRVRYAWSAAPCRGLLCDKSGLSAGPFSLQLR